MSDHMDRKLAGVTVRIDRERCIGSGNCVKVAPEVFELDDGNIVVFRSDAPDDVDRQRVTEACDVCPVDALIVYDEHGNQVVPRA